MNKPSNILYISILLCALLASLPMYGQPEGEDTLLSLATRLQRFGERIPQEKVFVHIDNTCYYLGDTIWFAAYTRQTNTDRPSKISRVLYAELWNHDGYLVERKLIEMKNGRGSGFFELYDTLYSGYFELRAYTRWQLNWGQTEHYNPWTVKYNTWSLSDFYLDYEKLYSRVFPVYDKPKEQGTYYKDMTYRPLRRYFKDAPPPPELRLSLFPEGGNLVAGVPCRVAFEAATSEGEVREGTVSLRMKNEEISMKNEQGDEVTSVRTENRGRGTFTFTPVEGQSYEVVFYADGDSTKKGRVTEKIKAVTGDGVSLRLRHTGEEWTANIQAMGSAAEHPLGMTVMHEGRLQCFTALTPDARQVVLADSTLSAGINQLTVFDAEGRVYADRLFFVTKPEETKARISVSGMKDEYTPFEQVNLQVTAPSLIGRLGSSEKPLNVASTPQRGANSSFATEGKAGGESSRLSFSVRDAVHQDNIFDSGNILTEMLLSSEIKGFVPQPEYFFEADDAEHRRALDLLMLTQGWRRFGWKEMAVEGAFELTHPAEYTQIVTGTVKQLHSSELGNSTTSIIDRDRLAENRRFIERGNLKREVRVHAEFVKALNQKAILIGETETMDGCFRIELPDFYGECIFFLDASDTTKWKKKWDGLRRRKKRHWVRRQDSEFKKFPDEPEFHVMLHWPYPRWIKPYNYYQVHYASLRDTTLLSPRLLIDGTRLMREVDVRARHNGRRHINFSKPAYVIDAYEATNMALDAGQLYDYMSKGSITNDTAILLLESKERTSRIDNPSLPTMTDDETKRIAYAVAHTLVADMGMTRQPDFSVFYDTLKVYGEYQGRREDFDNTRWIAPGDRRRWGRLEYLDKIYLYTDYSPRREGDARYEQSNQPSLDLRFVHFPGWERRMTYLNRYYILKGFAYQEDFYHPDYRRNPPKEGQKDYRRTLYWNPDLQLDEEGRANITFFNNSQTTRLCVEANGQAADGTLLYSGEQTKR